MKWSQAVFVARRVRNNLRELLWTHILTSGTMAMALFVFGAFLILQENLEHLLQGWGDHIQINVYLEKTSSGGDVEELLARVRSRPEVAGARHISQAQAWKDFQTALGSQSGLLEGLPRDVLPPSLAIDIKPDFRDGPAVEALARQLQNEKGVAAVEYPQQWVEHLSLAVLALQWAKWIVGGVLFLVTFFIVSSTVKLAVLARKDEIEIMQLVGASEALIQAPFVVEGMIQGLCGALASIAGLWAVFYFLRQQVPQTGGLFGPLAEARFLNPESFALLFAIGGLLGAAASLFSLRRFVKTWQGSVGLRAG